MITRDQLAARLARRNLAAWSLVERAQELATVDEQRAVARHERHTRLTVIVHLDVPTGRGSARLDLDPIDAEPDDVIDQAIALATAAVGPAWFSAPPAAPARVDVGDPGLVQRELDTAARNTLLAIHRPPALAVTARVELLREVVSVDTSAGFHVSWPATLARASAVVRAPTRDLAITLVRQSRRVDDLDLDTALANAAADLALLATAGAPPPAGPCALWLGPDAVLHDDDLGVWAIFAHQADAAVERQGLTRFRLRGELAPGAAQLAEPLSITSDGALDFAIRSTPVADDAVAVRRFPIVERGAAAGLGLSAREAALRASDPNGGVRNLVVAPGTWRAEPAALPVSPRAIEVRRLAALYVDPTTGDASLDIALGVLHTGDRAPVAFTGGTIHLDLITALALARRSSQLVRRGAYHGPAHLWIDDADLEA
ncbi:MAG TPA: metallopeptidase TldD-related protein [Kofleriaceae bacterium]|nr:metallopeptidase TldD-related protein [Kofleriaceae bacterium]